MNGLEPNKNYYLCDFVLRITEEELLTYNQKRITLWKYNQVKILNKNNHETY